MAEESTQQEETIEQQPKIKIARWLQKIIGVIIPVISILLAYLFAYLIVHDYFTPWDSYGSPPGGGGAVSFVDVNYSNDELAIFVETQAGDIYKHSLAVDGNWTRSTNEELSLLYSHCEPYNVPFTRPPGKVVDEIVIRPCWPEGSVVRYGLGWEPSEYRYAILVDGTVWGWMISDYNIGKYIWLRFVLGFTAFMLSGILWFLLQNHYHTIQPPRKEKFIVRLFVRIIFLLLGYSPFFIFGLAV